MATTPSQYRLDNSSLLTIIATTTTTTTTATTPSIRIPKLPFNPATTTTATSNTITIAFSNLTSHNVTTDDVNGDGSGAGPLISLAIPLLMFCTGVLGNVVALLLLWRSRRDNKRSVFYRLVAALAFTDLFGIVATSPVTILVYSNDRQWVGGQPLCDYFSFMLIFAGLATVLVVGCMAVERYLAILHPYVYERHLGPGKVKVALVIVWLVAALISCLPLAKVGRNVHYYPYTWCFFDSHSDRLVDQVYSFFYAGIGLVVIVITAVCNIAVMVVLLRMRRVSQNIGRSREGRTLNMTSEMQMIFFLAGIIFVFATCYSPLMIRVIINSSKTMPMNEEADLMAIRLASLNQILDPWVYLLFRRRLAGLLYSACKSVSPMQTMSSLKALRSEYGHSSYRNSPTLSRFRYLPEGGRSSPTLAENGQAEKEREKKKKKSKKKDKKGEKKTLEEQGKASSRDLLAAVTAKGGHCPELNGHCRSVDAAVSRPESGHARGSEPCRIVQAEGDDHLEVGTVERESQVSTDGLDHCAVAVVDERDVAEEVERKVSVSGGNGDSVQPVSSVDGKGDGNSVRCDITEEADKNASSPVCSVPDLQPCQRQSHTSPSEQNGIVQTDTTLEEDQCVSDSALSSDDLGAKVRSSSKCNGVTLPNGHPRASDSQTDSELALQSTSLLPGSLSWPVICHHGNDVMAKVDNSQEAGTDDQGFLYVLAKRHSYVTTTCGHCLDQNADLTFV